MKEVLFILLGYLSGSVLYAYYLPLWFLKLDVTQGARDQNPGAFNCIRRAGWPMGLLALACDIAKGALPVLWARHAVDMSAWCFALVLSAPVVGHAFSVFRHFRGGKAIAVSFGVLAGLLPLWQPIALLAVCYLFFSCVVRISPNRCRSIVTYVCFAALSIVWPRGRMVAAGCVLISAIVIARHLFSEEAPEAFTASLGLSRRER